MGSRNNNKPSSESSKPYALTKSDYEWLLQSTIPQWTADQFCFRVDDIEGAAQVGQKLTADRPMRGIIFRYYSPWGGHERERRLRRDVPDIDATGKESGKYIGPPDRPPLLFFPLLVNDEQFRAWLEDLTISIIFVEGEKKALALMRIALENAVDRRPPFIVIGLAGVWCWKRKDGPLPDFDLIPWRDRQVCIFFDSNVHTNYKVRGARKTFAEELHYIRGAKAFFAEMPRDCGLNGPDDLAYSKGDEAVLDCIDQAKRAINPTPPPQKETTEERLKRGAAMRAADAKAQEASNPSDLARRILGMKLWQRLAYLWAQAGKLESEERDLLFTLHAMAEGESSFEFYYADLYKLLYPCDGSEVKDGSLTSAARQRIRRRFDKLEAAEDRCGIQFLMLRHGYKDIEEGNKPSYVQLFSLDYLDQIESLAATDPQYTRNKQSAFRRAIAGFIRLKTDQPIKRNVKPAPNPFKAIANGWKRVEGDIKANVERMRRQGYEDWAIWQDAQKHLPSDLIASIQSSVRAEVKIGRAEDGQIKQESKGLKVKPNHEEIEVSPESVISPDTTQEPASVVGVDEEIRGIKSDTSKSSQSALDATNRHADFRKTRKKSAKADLRAVEIWNRYAAPSARVPVLSDGSPDSPSTASLYCGGCGAGTISECSC